MHRVWSTSVLDYVPLVGVSYAREPRIQNYVYAMVPYRPSMAPIRYLDLLVDVNLALISAAANHRGVFP